MALSVALIDHGTDTSGFTTTVTNPITPGTNTLVLVFVFANFANPTGLVLPAGAGLTFTQIVTDHDYGAGRAGNLWRGLTASPATDSLRMSNPGGLPVMWQILEVSGGVDTSGTNGSGAVRQLNVADGSSPLDAGLTASLSTSALIGIWGLRDETQTSTVGSGYTSLLNSYSYAWGVMSSEWKTGTTDGLCGWTWAGTAGVAIGVEAQAASSPPPPSPVESWLPQAGMIVLPHLGMLASGSMPGSRVP